MGFQSRCSTRLFRVLQVGQRLMREGLLLEFWNYELETQIDFDVKFQKNRTKQLNDLLGMHCA